MPKLEKLENVSTPLLARVCEAWAESGDALPLGARQALSEASTRLRDGVEVIEAANNLVKKIRAYGGSNGLFGDEIRVLDILLRSFLK